MRKCYLCNREGSFPDGDVELRPYGPKGQDVCFECAMSTPEHEKEAERQFEAQFEACGNIPVIGLDVGPIPIKSAGLEVKP